jgi:hypothetical protein
MENYTKMRESDTAKNIVSDSLKRIFIGHSYETAFETLDLMYELLKEWQANAAKDIIVKESN